MMGRTNNPKEVLLNSSISLNTSDFEGFALTVLEANECGVPTITFNFGESANEEVIDGKTGYVADDREDYIKKLKNMMDDSKLLQEMGKQAKKYNDNFKIKNIVKDWERLFNNEKR
jgi:glycosyltransferase involved in cell wall biosynthesis